MCMTTNVNSILKQTSNTQALYRFDLLVFLFLQALPKDYRTIAIAKELNVKIIMAVPVQEVKYTKN